MMNNWNFHDTQASETYRGRKSRPKRREVGGRFEEERVNPAAILEEGGDRGHTREGLACCLCSRFYNAGDILDHMEECRRSRVEQYKRLPPPYEFSEVLRPKTLLARNLLPRIPGKGASLATVNHFNKASLDIYDAQSLSCECCGAKFQPDKVEEFIQHVMTCDGGNQEPTLEQPIRGAKHPEPIRERLFYPKQTSPTYGKHKKGYVDKSNDWFNHEPPPLRDEYHLHRNNEIDDRAHIIPNDNSSNANQRREGERGGSQKDSNRGGGDRSAFEVEAFALLEKERRKLIDESSKRDRLENEYRMLEQEHSDLLKHVNILESNTKTLSHRYDEMMQNKNNEIEKLGNMLRDSQYALKRNESQNNELVTSLGLKITLLQDKLKEHQHHSHHHHKSYPDKEETSIKESLNRTDTTSSQASVNTKAASEEGDNNNDNVVVLDDDDDDDDDDDEGEESSSGSSLEAPMKLKLKKDKKKDKKVKKHRKKEKRSILDHESDRNVKLVGEISMLNKRIEEERLAQALERSNLLKELNEARQTIPSLISMLKKTNKKDKKAREYQAHHHHGNKPGIVNNNNHIHDNDGDDEPDNAAAQHDDDKEGEDRDEEDRVLSNEAQQALVELESLKEYCGQLEKRIELLTSPSPTKKNENIQNSSEYPVHHIQPPFDQMHQPYLVNHYQPQHTPYQGNYQPDSLHPQHQLQEDSFNPNISSLKMMSPVNHSNEVDVEQKR
jgi:hypothetical protein